MAENPEYRWNPFDGTWVIVAAGRAQRPSEFPPRPRPRRTGACPFCVGHESETPPALAEYRQDGVDGGWQVRVVPNKYPALAADPTSGSSVDHGSLPWDEFGFGTSAVARGRHEVIIESPQHVVDWHDLTDADVALIVRAYRDRLRAVRDAGLEYGLVFKNVFPEAGASMEHAHSQLVGMNHLPPRVHRLTRRALQYRDDHGRCQTCAWLEWECQQRHRLVWQTEEYAVVAPYFSRVPGELWIVPRTHEAHFDQLDDRLLAPLGRVLRKSVTTIRAQLRCEAYNLVLQTPPFCAEDGRAVHWQIQLLPRQVALAGFEWATGCYINTLPPEEAADRLRGI